MMGREGKANLRSNLEAAGRRQKYNVGRLEWILRRKQDTAVIDPTCKLRVVSSPDGKVPANK